MINKLKKKAKQLNEKLMCTVVYISRYILRKSQIIETTIIQHV